MGRIENVYQKRDNYKAWALYEEYKGYRNFETHEHYESLQLLSDSYLQKIVDEAGGLEAFCNLEEIKILRIAWKYTHEYFDDLSGDDSVMKWAKIAINRVDMQPLHNALCEIQDGKRVLSS